MQTATEKEKLNFWLELGRANTQPHGIYRANGSQVVFESNDGQRLPICGFESGQEAIAEVNSLNARYQVGVEG
jgi:hypothetical protein